MKNALKLLVIILVISAISCKSEKKEELSLDVTTLESEVLSE